MSGESDESLEEFAKGWSPTSGKTCGVCLLPEREDIDRARRDKRVPQSAVKAWLVKKKGYTPEQVAKLHNSFDTHFRRGHHERSE